MDLEEMAAEYRRSASIVKTTLSELESSDLESVITKRKISVLRESYKELIGIANYLERYYSGARTNTAFGRYCSSFKPEVQTKLHELNPVKAQYSAPHAKMFRSERRSFPELERYCILVAQERPFSERLIQAAEATLTPKQFQIFKLHYVDGMTYTSIAEINGIFASTAFRTAEHARENINDLIVCYPGEYPSRAENLPAPKIITREVYIELFALLEQTKTDLYGKQLYRIVSEQLGEKQMKYATAHFVEKKSEDVIFKECGVNRATVCHMLKTVRRKLQTIIELNAIAILRIISEVDDIKYAELMGTNKVPPSRKLRDERRRDRANAY